MKRKFCSILLALCMVLTLLPTTALAAGKYNDTEGHWAEDSINRWSDHEIIEGSDGSFAPNDSLTRGQMAVILCRLLNLPAAPSAKFTDVDEGAWYADAINRCAAAGIMLGADGKAMPGEPISREQSMVMLCRALDIAPVENPDLSKYADADRISDYAKGYVAALIDAGIINGVTDDTVAPQDEINRASTVTILDRAIITYADEPGQTVEANGGIVIVAADNVTVTGNAGSVIVSSPEGKVTLDNVTTETVTVTSEGGNVTLNNSTVGSMNVNAPDTGVETKGTTTVETVSTKAENTAITTGGKSEIGTVSVGGNAAGTTVNAGSGTTIGSVENAGSGTTVTGSGKVESVSSSTDVTVETKGTEVTNSGEGKISVTDQNGKENEVTAGESTTQTPSTPSTPSGGSSGGGSSAPSHSHTWVLVPADPATCTTAGKLAHYACSGCGKLSVGDGVYTITEDAALTIAKQNHHSYNDSHKCEWCNELDSEFFAAKIGETGYQTLAAAVAAAQNNDTVTLLKDEDNSAVNTIIVEKDITLDLNGHTLTLANTDGKGNINIKNATFTLKDSTDTQENGTGTGKIITATHTYRNENNSVNNKVLIAAVDGGNFIMESGLIDSASGIENNTNNGQFAVGVMNTTSDTTASVTINGGKIKAGWYAVCGNGVATNGTGNITVNGGILESTADYAIYHPQKGTTTINGGVVYGVAGGIHLNRGTLVVTGGTITSKGTGSTGNWGDGTGNSGAAAVNVHANYGDATAEIKGGMLIAETNALLLASTDPHTGRIEVTGGTFSADPSAYLAAGYGAKPQGGKYVVTQHTGSHTEFTYSTDWTSTPLTSKVVCNTCGYVAEEANTYYINSDVDLIAFANKVKANNLFEGKTVKLMADINLKDVEGFNGVGANSYSHFPSHAFNGTFDGGNHIISNMTVSSTGNEGTAGFFPQLGNNAVVQNLKFDYATVTSNHEAGVVAGYCRKASGNGVTIPMSAKIINCHVTNSTVTSTTHNSNGSWDDGDKVGGIIGIAACEVSNCIVKDTQIKAYRDVGGIVGYADGATISGNKLEGTVTITVNNDHNYKNYTTNNDYDANSIIGQNDNATDSGNSGEATITRPFNS